MDQLVIVSFIGLWGIIPASFHPNPFYFIPPPLSKGVRTLT